MADGILVLRLHNFEGQIIRNVSTRLQFRKDQKQAGNAINRTFASGRERFKVPAFPLAVWDCWVTAQRFEIRNTGFFRPMQGQRIEREIWLPRKVGADWATRFARWDQLTGRFAPLRKLLTNSPNLTLRIKNKGSRPLGSFTGNTYDDVDDRQLILGKAGLLNMYAKLMATPVPGVPGVPWFAGIQRLLGIQRDRVVGIVNPGMARTVRRILDNPSAFPGYRNASTGEHFKKNIRPLIPPTFSKIRDYSVKTRDRIGVLQLVIAEVRNPQGQTVFTLDADIDENGNLLKHFGDFIKHQFNGGTHPFHVHDILHRTLKSPLLAYRLT